MLEEVSVTLKLKINEIRTSKIPTYLINTLIEQKIANLLLGR